MTQDPNAALAALFDLPPFGVAAEERRVRLQAAMATELAHHLDRNADFRRLCARRGIAAADPARPLSDYPLLPAIAFKRLGAHLLSVPPEDVRFTLTSSATGGAPSEVRVDAVTARRQTRALGRVLGSLLGARRRPYIFVDVDPEITPHLIGARRAAVLGYMRQASSSHFVVRAGEDGGRLLLDEDLLEAAARAAAGAETPPVLFGFTYVLFDLLVRPWHRAGRKLELPPGSAVLHIGGWKKLEAERVDRATFKAMAGEVLGVHAERIFDVYGFTEQMGMNYPECPAGSKHVPAFGEVFVRDPVTLELLPDGREGLLHFVTPLPHSYPGISVVTDDLGVIAGRDACTCGRLGTAFQVTGRAALAEVRGCGDILADKYLDPGRDPGRPRAAEDATWQVLLHRGEEPGGFLSPETVLSDLRRAHEWLKRVPLEGLVALLAQAAQRWLAVPELAPFRKQGLEFLAQWMTGRQLRGLLDFALRGGRGALDGPVPSPVDPRIQWLLVPRGLAVHWVAGNVPLIGWFLLAQTILTRNLNVVKVPSALRHLLPLMLQELGRCAVRLPQGLVQGRDLLQTISVVYHGHGHPAAETLSRAADVRVAWGGREAMEALAGLPRRYDCQDVFFGPKLSYMCIGRETLAAERPYQRLLRNAAVDCSVFDQAGCSSPHTIFVESGGRITPEAFAADLAGEMARAAERIPPAGWDSGIAQAIRLRRLEYEMRHQVWHSPDLSWTVLHDEEEGLAEPCYGRVVTVRGLQDVQEAAALAHPDIQSIGLALSGERRLAFAEAAAERGVCRLPEIGKMTHFEWIWDGFPPLDRLVRWVTVGGP